MIRALFPCCQSYCRPLFQIATRKTAGNRRKIRPFFDVLHSRQASAFAQAFADFQALDAVVLGVSKDSTASHQKFAAKYDLPFRLLSDPELTTLQAYGVWQEKKLYGKTSMGVVRSTYVIDGDGIIRHAMPKVKPDANAGDVLALLKQPE